MRQRKTNVQNDDNMKVKLVSVCCSTVLIVYRLNYVSYRIVAHRWYFKRLNRIESNRIESNQIKSNQIESNQIESNRIKSIHEWMGRVVKSNRIE
jgi:hypothetical protein